MIDVGFWLVLLLDGMVGRRKTPGVHFTCNCLILREVARPERFELWFVGRWSKISKCRYWYRLRAKRATYSALKLDGSWTEPIEVNPYDGTNSFRHSSRFDLPLFLRQILS